jgi:hypothetical protein
MHRQECYDPPDVRNPFRGTDGAVDYLSKMAWTLCPTWPVSRQLVAWWTTSEARIVIANWRILPLFLVGMDPGTRSAPHLCDGSYDSFCGERRIVCFMGQMTTVEVSSSIVTAGG